MFFDNATSFHVLDHVVCDSILAAFSWVEVFKLHVDPILHAHVFMFMCNEPVDKLAKEVQEYIK